MGGISRGNRHTQREKKYFYYLSQHRCMYFVCFSWLPCTDTVRWSYYSQDRSLYWCHSGTVHRLEIPTNPWDTDDQSYTHTETQSH